MWLPCTGATRSAVSSTEAAGEAAGRDGSAKYGAGAGPARAEVPGSGRKQRRRRRAAQVGAGGLATAGGVSGSPPTPEPARGREEGNANPSLCHTLPISIVVRGNLIKPGAINP